MNKGLLISFEGGEGSGKSTQVPLLKQALEDAGLGVLLTREPGGTPIGEKIRHLLKHDPDGKDMVARAELLLFLAARAQNFDQIIVPAVNEGQIVICDRFIDSSVVYQGIVRGLGAEIVTELNSFATAGQVPDITFIFDVPVEVGLERVHRREGELPALWDRMDGEDREFHQKVRDGYLSLVKTDPKRYILIDTASMSIEEITKELLKHATDRLAQRA